MLSPRLPRVHNAAMSYVEQTLSEGESIVYEARFHWLYTLQAWLVLLLVGWVAGLGVVLFFMMMIRKWTTEIAITNRRVVYKRGWIARKTDELSLSRIEEVNLEQGVLGRMFGYGKVKLGGVGVGEIDLPDIDEPVEFRRAIGVARTA